MLQIKRMLLQHQKYARALKEGGVRIMGLGLGVLFLSRKLLFIFLCLCDYSDKFPKMFCSSCGGDCPSTANFCHQYGQQVNLSHVTNKAASSVDKETLLKEYFHRRYPYSAIVSLLEKRRGVRMHVRFMSNGRRYIHTHYAIAFAVNSIHVFSHLRQKSAIKGTTRL